MIYLILFLLFFSLGKNLKYNKILSWTSKQSPELLIKETKEKENINYNIIDLYNNDKNEYNYEYAKSLLSKIYYSFNIKIFIYIINDINSDVDSFLNYLKSKLGYELDKTSYPKNYFIIIILTEKNECFFIESEKIKNKKDEISFIIFNNRKYLIDKNYFEFVNQLSMQLYEDIFNECVTIKDKIIRITCGIILLIIIIIFAYYFNCSPYTFDCCLDLFSPCLEACFRDQN